MISGPKSYLPTKVTKELKDAGMGGLLYKDKISKEQAVKALKLLRDKGVVSRLSPVSTMYRRAGIEQVALDEQVRALKAQKHIQANIKIDVGEEMSAEDRGESSTHYDPRSVLGKRVIDQVDRERAAREKKIKSSQDTRDSLTKNATVKPQKPSITMSENLPDIDIG